MEEDSGPCNPELFELVRSAFEEGWKKIQTLRAQKSYISGYWNWPKLTYFQNGFPNFSESHFLDPSPTDYSTAFGKNYDWQIRTSEIPTFQKLLSYARTNKELRAHFAWGPNPLPEDFYTIMVEQFVEKLIDRYIHLFPDTPPDDTKFTQIYRPMENYVYQDTLLVDIVAPILFLKFDFDKHILGPTVLIEKMPEDFQLARFSCKAYSPTPNSCVLGAATHALVLKGWSINRTTKWQMSSNMSDPSYYRKPLENVDAFFASLRIAAGLKTGYAQILLRPLNWAHYYRAHLPPVEGTSLRRYPPWFENFYWNEPIDTVSIEQLEKSAKIYHNLVDAENNKLKIAVRRLNACYLREGDEDSILDATIAMEALLSDDERQEISHKLALRIAALSTLAPNQKESPSEVFKAIKLIYRYRSRIIHGSTKIDKGRQISIAAEQDLSPVELAIGYLRMLIGVLTDHPQYLKPSNIDHALLLNVKN